MTLILAIATPRYVALLSDRRITKPVWNPEDGKYDYISGDTDTKSIFIDAHYIMGFAGLGTVGASSQRMEAWLVDELAEGNASNRFDLLASKFGELCEKRNYWRSHTFVAPGFYRDQTGKYCPEIVVVSNSLSGDSRIVKDRPNFAHTFDVHRVRLQPKQSYLFLSAGATVEPGVEDELRRLIHRRQAGRRDLDAHLLIPKLVEVLRATARVNSTVGTSCLVTTFPMTALPLKFVQDSRLFDSEELPATKDFRTRKVSVTIAEHGSRDTMREFHPAWVSEQILSFGSFSERVNSPDSSGVLNRTMGDAEAAFKRDLGRPYG